MFYEWMLTKDITVTGNPDGSVTVNKTGTDVHVMLDLTEGVLFFDEENVDVGDNLPVYLGIFDAAELGVRVHLIGGAEGYYGMREMKTKVTYAPVICGVPASYKILVREEDDFDSYAENVCAEHLEPSLHDLLSDDPEGQFPVVLPDESPCQFNVGPAPQWFNEPDAAGNGK